MQTEIEIKYCQLDVDEMRARLQSAGATCEQPMRLMRRALIEQPEHAAEYSFLRIRDEGDKTTLTFKRRATMDASAQSIDDTQEIEVTVSDFDKTVEIFRQAGWPPVSYQESKRETWHLGGAEIVIDVWPGLMPYIEIEADDEIKVRQAAEKLGFNWADAFHGRIDNVYQLEYDFEPGFRGPVDVAELRFDAPLPEQFVRREA